MEQKSIEGLIDFIAARQPDFLQKIVGASAAEIEELNTVVRRIVGLDLPEDYRAFLSFMGNSEPPFSFTYDATPVIREVLEKHQILLEENDDLPPNSFLIAVYGFSVEEIALECFIDEGKSRSGRVFIPDGDRVGEYLGDGFIEYLYGQAFKYVFGAKTPFTETLIGKQRAPNLQQIENVAARFRIEKKWFSDSITLCACDSQENIVVYARQKLNEYAWVRISGKDQKQVTALKESLRYEARLNFE